MSATISHLSHSSSRAISLKKNGLDMQTRRNQRGDGYDQFDAGNETWSSAFPMVTRDLSVGHDKVSVGHAKVSRWS